MAIGFMANKAKLDILPVNARDDVANYAKKHSFREVAIYIKEKYNISVSYVSVRSWLQTSYKRLPVEVQNLQFDLVISAEDILQRFDSLYRSAKNIKARTVILSKYADYVNAMMKAMPNPNLENLERTKSKLTETLEWQKGVAKHKLEKETS